MTRADCGPDRLHFLSADGAAHGGAKAAYASNPASAPSPPTTCADGTNLPRRTVAVAAGGRYCSEALATARANESTSDVTNISMESAKRLTEGRHT